MTGIRGANSGSGVSGAPFTRQFRFSRRPVRALLCLFGFLALLSSVALTAWAGVGGSISGAVRDPSGGVVPRASVTATNTETGIRQSAYTDDKGFYSFPSLAIGHYDLAVEVASYKPYRRTQIVVNANSALTVDVTLELGQRNEVMTVREN